MTLLQDLMLTSRTIYVREREILLAEMKKEAQNLAEMLREESREGELLDKAREADAYWQRRLTDLRDEQGQRDQAIRQFCEHGERLSVRAEVTAQ
jgi:hypothetical protein